MRPTRKSTVIGLLCVLGVPGAASGAPAWQPREEIPAAPANVTLLPGGAAFVIGQPAAKSPFGQRNRYAMRPVGGPLGAPDVLPGALASSGVRTAHDAAGNVLMGDVDLAQAAYRSAGGVFSGLQNLGSGNGVTAISMAPSGEAFFGLGGSPGDLKVAFRPAGPDAQVDVANAQILPGSGRMIGVQLDPDGAGIVVYFNNAGQLLQATRAAGQASFGNPVSIPSGLADPTQFQVRMAADPSGWAILTWGGEGSVNNKVDRAIAAIRPPGGVFGAPADLGGTISVRDVVGAINAVGHGVATWSDFTKPPDSTCQGAGDTRGGDVVARAAVYTGAWSVGSMGPGTWPEISFPAAVSAAGSTIALVTGQASEGPGQCSVVDDTRTLFVHRGVSTGATFAWVETTVLQASEPTAQANGQHFGVDLNALDVEPGGNILTAVTSGQLRRYLRAFEEPVVPGSGGGGGGDGGGGGAVLGGPVQTGLMQAAIKPIVPKDLVAIVSLRPDRPTVDVVCPPEVADECRFRFAVRLAFGVKPSAAAAKQGVLIGTGTAAVAPGAKKRVAIRLNKAGKKVVARRKAVKVLVTATVTVGTQRSSFTKSTKLRAAKRKKR